MDCPDQALIIRQKKIYTKLIESVRIELDRDSEHIYYEDPSLIHLSPGDLKAEDLYRVKDNKKFVSSCYMKLLDRYPSEDLMKRHLKNIDDEGHKARTKLLNEIMCSQEYRVRRVDFPCL